MFCCFGFSGRYLPALRHSTCIAGCSITSTVVSRWLHSKSLQRHWCCLAARRKNPRQTGLSFATLRAGMKTLLDECREPLKTPRTEPDARATFHQLRSEARIQSCRIANMAVADDCTCRRKSSVADRSPSGSMPGILKRGRNSCTDELWTRQI